MTNIKKSSKVNYLNVQLHPKNPQAETILNLKKTRSGLQYRMNLILDGFTRYLNQLTLYETL